MTTDADRDPRLIQNEGEIRRDPIFESERRLDELYDKADRYLIQNEQNRHAKAATTDDLAKTMAQLLNELHFLTSVPTEQGVISQFHMNVELALEHIARLLVFHPKGVPLIPEFAPQLLHPVFSCHGQINCVAMIVDKVPQMVSVLLPLLAADYENRRTAPWYLEQYGKHWL